MTDKTREDFHSWMRDRFWVGVNLVRSPDGYVSTVSHPSLPMTYASVEMMWESYQSATQHSAARIAELEAEVQELRRDAERLAEKAAAHDAINRACKELPPGYDLHIELEKDAGIVRLYLPDTDADISDFGSDLGFVGEINAAVDAAIEAERAKP